MSGLGTVASDHRSRSVDHQSIVQWLCLGKFTATPHCLILMIMRVHEVPVVDDLRGLKLSGHLRALTLTLVSLLSFLRKSVDVLLAWELLIAARSQLRYVEIKP